MERNGPAHLLLGEVLGVISDFGFVALLILVAAQQIIWVATAHPFVNAPIRRALFAKLASTKPIVGGVQGVYHFDTPTRANTLALLCCLLRPLP